MVYHGFPINITLGKFSRESFHSIINQIDLKWPHERNLVIDATWMKPDFQATLDLMMDHYDPTQVFCGCLVDPWLWEEKWAQQKFQDVETVRYFGTISGPYHFDTIAQAFYSESRDLRVPDLDMDRVFKRFSCLQHKPHVHRQQLMNRLQSTGLESAGWVSLQSNSGIPMVWQYQSRTVDTIPDRIEDIWYNLGDMDVWRRHFLSVCSETSVEDSPHVFITEKIWKPILGMRPFVILANPQVLPYLQDKGFDTFLDIWPIKHIPGQDTTGQIDYIQAVLEWLCTQSLAEIYDLYQSLRPRLLRNRARFIEYVKENQWKSQNLFCEPNQ